MTEFVFNVRDSKGAKLGSFQTFLFCGEWYNSVILHLAIIFVLYKYRMRGTEIEFAHQNLKGPRYLNLWGNLIFT